MSARHSVLSEDERQEIIALIRREIYDTFDAAWTRGAHDLESPVAQALGILREVALRRVLPVKEPKPHLGPGGPGGRQP